MYILLIFKTMEVKQEPFVIKVEPYSICGFSRKTDSPSEPSETFNNNQLRDVRDSVTQNSQCTVNIFEPPVNVCNIKQEIIELEVPKIEERSDGTIKFEHDFVCEKVQSFPDEMNIRQVKAADMFVDIKDIKQEVTDYVQIKTESGLLTTHCDLPTLKTENTEYFEQPCSSKQADRILKPLKNNNKRRYPCSICQKSYPSSKSRQNHIDRHFGKLPATLFRSSRKNLIDAQFGRSCETCYYCSQCFLTKSQLKSHFIVSHYVKKVGKLCKRKFGQHIHCRCKNCLRTKFRHPPTANIIFDSNRKQRLQCKIYSKSFLTEINLNNQLKIHAVHTGENPFVCEICLKRFTRKSSLKKHSLIHTGDKTFACEICSKRFATKSYFNDHLKVHTGEKPFVCEICSKRFTRKSSLKKHSLIHTRDKTFACEICSKQFKWNCDFKKHLIIHTEKNPFECQICLKQFRYKSTLKIHLRIHTEEKSFMCEICSKQFLRKSDLNDHLIIHTEEKRFACEICSKRFLHKKNFKKHLKIHTAKKSFKCEICSNQFFQKSDLKKHAKIHTGEKPFACEICSKRFSQRGNLKNHLTIHTGEKSFMCHTREKSFKCEICSNQFFRKGDLKTHSKIHTGEKPFACEICSKRFTQKHSLKRHSLLHT